MMSKMTKPNTIHLHSNGAVRYNGALLLQSDKIALAKMEGFRGFGQMYDFYYSMGTLPVEYTTNNDLGERFNGKK